jgi:predicted TIM-barrel fold metal-dependent hydrolase
VLRDDVKLISVDDHVVEPPNVFVDRLPAKYQEDGPRVVPLNDQDEAWCWEGRTYPIGLMGSPKTRIFREGQEGTGEDFRARSYRDMVPACYDVHERVKSMDVDGVGASLNFPTFPRFAGTLFLEGVDPELTSACVRAYNDWMIDEWCGSAPDRFIPMTVVQLWDPVLAAEEVRRCAAKGSKSITMCENPAPLGLPSFWTDHWDPLWDAVQETDLVVSMHIGTSGGLVRPSDDSSEAVSISLCGLNSMSACAELIFSGTLQKFPGLRIALSEGGAGWAPYLVERMDYTWERTRLGVDKSIPPSELFKRHFWACFIWDETAIQIRDLLGFDKLMWECDFPHNDGNWPDSRTMLEKAMRDVPDDVCLAVAETNARALYDFAL